MTHLTRNDCASALRLLEQLESGCSPVRRGTGMRMVDAPSGRRGWRRRSMRADDYRRAGLEHAVAVAFLYRLACQVELPLAAAPVEVTPSGLTPREADVMHWVSRGKTDAETAALLRISPRTVHKHLEHIYVKLGVETRTAAVMRTLAMSKPRELPPMS